jgi:hypothetical protein
MLSETSSTKDNSLSSAAISRGEKNDLLEVNRILQTRQIIKVPGREYFESLKLLEML